MSHRLLLALLLCLALPAQADTPAQPEDTIAVAAQAAVTTERFMVAAAHPEASRVGHEVLEAGGNAVDAMVAVQLMLNLVEPQSSGHRWRQLPSLLGRGRRNSSMPSTGARRRLRQPAPTSSSIRPQASLWASGKR